MSRSRDGWQGIQFVEFSVQQMRRRASFTQFFSLVVLAPTKIQKFITFFEDVRKNESFVFYDIFFRISLDICSLDYSWISLLDTTFSSYNLTNFCDNDSHCDIFF
jgi:hypothetical protein